MHAELILQRSFEDDLTAVHLSRVRAVLAVVYALLRTGRLSLTSLGRAMSIGTSPKHGIKRVDRLLGNTGLHSDRVEFYRTIARRLILPGSRPVIIVDWTAVTPQLWALVAAVSHQGRALIVYAETHGIGSYLKPHVNEAFVTTLRAVLPACSPIVLTDAGFRSPWMKLIQAQGWDYVGRMRGLARIRRDRSEAWSDIERVWQMTSARPGDLGFFEFGQKTRFRTRVIGVRKKSTYRRRPAQRDFGPERQRRAAYEPWILATSLAAPASMVVKLYARRMQVEQTFRDTKSHRFGISLAYARTRSPLRADVLLLLASLAHVIYVLTGLAAEASRLHLKYQANTTTARRVISLAMLGRLVFAQYAETLLMSAISKTGWSALQQRLTQPSGP